MPKVLDKQWKVLKEAKKHLSYEPTTWWEEDETGKRQYICHAIAFVVNSETNWGCYEQEYVRELLEELESLEHWLVENDYATWDEIDSPEGGIKMQTTRHAWIDWMIKDCKKRNI